MMRNDNGFLVLEEEDYNAMYEHDRETEETTKNMGMRVAVESNKPELENCAMCDVVPSEKMEVVNKNESTTVYLCKKCADKVNHAYYTK